MEDPHRNEPDEVAESIEQGPHVLEIGSLVPGLVKPVTYIKLILVASYITMIGQVGLAQCYDNVTEWDIWSWDL